MKRTFLITFLIIVLLSACGGDVTETAVAELPTNTAEPTATDTAVPTDTPTPAPTETPVPTDTPTPVPTNTPEPTSTPTEVPQNLAGYERFESVEKQMIFQHPIHWIVNEDASTGMILAMSDSSLMFSDSIENGTLLFMIVDSDGNFDGSPEDVVAGFISNIEGSFVSDLKNIQEFKTYDVGKQQVGIVEYAATMVDTEEAVTFISGIVVGDGKSALFFGVSTPETYEASDRDVVANILNTMELDAEVTAPPEKASIYLVDQYDPARDPSSDLVAAISIAEAEGKHILLIVGGDWCVTCHMLEFYIDETQAVARGLAERFVILKVNYSEGNENEAFLGDYPEIEWFPHFFILESDGTLAESYDTRQIETEGLYDYEKFVEFLDQWPPEGVESKGDSFYLVKAYDPARDPFADVETAVSQAQAENKNILLIVGGDWCIWCNYLESFIDTDNVVNQMLLENYLVLKVNVSETNENEKFFSQYPEVPGYPHLFVLDQNGEFLHSQGTLALELGDTDTYDPEKFAAFLQEWAP